MTKITDSKVSKTKKRSLGKVKKAWESYKETGDVTILSEALEEGIFGNPADKKSAIIRYAGIKVEDAIRFANLGKELYADHPSVEQFEAIRQELIDLKRWLRQRK